MSTPAEDTFVARSTGTGSRADRVLDLLMGVRRPFALVIDGAGIAVRGAAGVVAAWEEIADVYVLLDGVNRYLVYPLTPPAAAARGRARTRHPGRWHEPSLLWAVQPGVRLMMLDRDEHEVLGAVARFSGGRFPSPERQMTLGRRDTLRRDMFGPRRVPPPS